MKKLYRIVMSKGEDFVFEESLIRKIMASEDQQIEVPMENRSIWINKAHIVCVFLDREETALAKSKEYIPNLPPENEVISLEKIRELKEKAKKLAIDKKIIEKPIRELKKEALEKLNMNDLPFQL